MTGVGDTLARALAKASTQAELDRLTEELRRQGELGSLERQAIQSRSAEIALAKLGAEP